MKSKIQSLLPKFHNSERGDIPVSTLLIVGAIVLPLVFFLIGFKNDISDWVNDRAGEAMAEDEVKDFDSPF